MQLNWDKPFKYRSWLAFRGVSGTWLVRGISPEELRKSRLQKWKLFLRSKSSIVNCRGMFVFPSRPWPRNGRPPSSSVHLFARHSRSDQQQQASYRASAMESIKRALIKLLTIYVTLFMCFRILSIHSCIGLSRFEARFKLFAADDLTAHQTPMFAALIVASSYLHEQPASIYHLTTPAIWMRLSLDTPIWVERLTCLQTVNVTRWESAKDPWSNLVRFARNSLGSGPRSTDSCRLTLCNSLWTRDSMSDSSKRH